MSINRKNFVLKTLKEISNGIPIIWDRVVDAEDYCAVYGWISRSDNKRDFVCYVCFNCGDNDFTDFYITSSAKYSQNISDNLNGEGHIDCIKFSDWKLNKTFKN